MLDETCANFDAFISDNVALNISCVFRVCFQSITGY